MSNSAIPFPQSPVVPSLVEGNHVIQFQCRKGIDCWNACCSNIDISLTPYDVVRLKRRLGLTSTEFLRDYTVPYEMDKDDIASVKFRPVDGGTACRFMTPEGCSVYADRPTACRYYPVALLSMRKQDESVDKDSYALVKEEHCHGHAEPVKMSIDDYRKQQGLPEYDDLARGWRQLVLKKKSSGPSIGKPSLRSRQLFFMACYDIDVFREFVGSESFTSVFDLPPEEKESFKDDVVLLQFAFRFLKQVLFGEQTLPLKEEAAQARREQLKAKRSEEEREAAARLLREEEGPTSAADEGFD
ncbi:MAG: YkgJ family cysteine cluster protein [Betaproteobacteria bacterium]|nr:YkgJ family cysteine cluster protein [Betaproteobacteria bacterium]